MFDTFRENCPLLNDKPEAEFPPVFEIEVAKATETMMWVAWAQARDWPWWTKHYESLDKGKKLYDDFMRPLRLGRGSGKENPNAPLSFDHQITADYRLALQEANRLYPILRRLADLGYRMCRWSCRHFWIRARPRCRSWICAS